MYLLHVDPKMSSKWQPPEGEELITADKLALDAGARNINKADAAGMENEQRKEEIPAATEAHGIHDVSHTDYVPESTGAHGHN